ncbi:MAG: biopolymer transporter ExbD [Chitinophagaceae bacterium]|nr:biopolymer transporter ExbD [Chitinophagaceae bacterium]
MPSVKIPRKSTDTDMTPFVDVAFLILSFFIMATKFKPPQPVEIETPASVQAQTLPEDKAVMISIDSLNRVFFTLLSEKDESKYLDVIKDIDANFKLGLTPAEMQNFRHTYMIGVPIGSLKQLLSIDPKEHKMETQPGIPVSDSNNNELVWWIRAVKNAFAGEKGFRYLIKGDGRSKYPAFDAVIYALKKNEEFKYNLVTSLDEVPPGTEFDKTRFFKPEE